MTTYNQNLEFIRLMNESPVEAVQRECLLVDSYITPYIDSIVLFGAGELGRKTLSGLRRCEREVVAFSDNNSLLWGSVIEGIPVLSPTEAAERYGQFSLFVITIWRAGSNHRMAMTRQQLLNLNCAQIVPFALLFWRYPESFLPYFVFDLPSVLLKQNMKIIQAYELWADKASRQEYLCQLRFRFHLDFDGLPSPSIHQQYFPCDIFSITHNEIFVDCGAFNGDTIHDLLKLQPDFTGKIYALEPDPSNFKQLCSFVNILPQQIRDNIRILPNAVGRQRETLRFTATGTSASLLNPNGELNVECLPIDEILADTRPSFIKMDIEGAEIEALEGARRTINNSLPILAISVYHNPDHIWLIPILIKSMSSDYQLYLRAHNEEGWDLVCYAIPLKRLNKHVEITNYE